ALDHAPRRTPVIATAEPAPPPESVALPKSEQTAQSATPEPAAPAAVAMTARPEPVAAAAPPPPPPVPQGALVDAYGRHLAEMLRRQHEYPRVAAMRGWEGEVRLRLRVARKGSLVAVQVDRSSGFDVLDQHALAMVEHLPALPPLPAGLLSSEIQFVVPELYRLEKPT
ncbi:MAG: energy transducer TonB, partial [Rhodocyclaceae bacterium]